MKRPSTDSPDAKPDAVRGGVKAGALSNAPAAGQVRASPQTKKGSQGKQNATGKNENAEHMNPLKLPSPQHCPQQAPPPPPQPLSAQQSHKQQPKSTKSVKVLARGDAPKGPDGSTEPASTPKAAPARKSSSPRAVAAVAVPSTPPADLGHASVEQPNDPGKAASARPMPSAQELAASMAKDMAQRRQERQAQMMNNGPASRVSLPSHELATGQDTQAQMVVPMLTQMVAPLLTQARTMDEVMECQLQQHVRQQHLLAGQHCQQAHLNSHEDMQQPLQQRLRLQAQSSPPLQSKLPPQQASEQPGLQAHGTGGQQRGGSGVAARVQEKQESEAAVVGPRQAAKHAPGKRGRAAAVPVADASREQILEPQPGAVSKEPATAVDKGKAGRNKGKVVKGFVDKLVRVEAAVDDDKGVLDKALKKDEQDITLDKPHKKAEKKMKGTARTGQPTKAKAAAGDTEEKNAEAVGGTQAGGVMTKHVQASVTQKTLKAAKDASVMPRKDEGMHKHTVPTAEDKHADDTPKTRERPAAPAKHTGKALKTHAVKASPASSEQHHHNTQHDMPAQDAPNQGKNAADRAARPATASVRNAGKDIARQQHAESVQMPVGTCADLSQGSELAKAAAPTKERKAKRSVEHYVPPNARGGKDKSVDASAVASPITGGAAPEHAGGTATGESAGLASADRRPPANKNAAGRHGRAREGAPNGTPSGMKKDIVASAHAVGAAAPVRPASAAS